MKKLKSILIEHYIQHNGNKSIYLFGSMHHDKHSLKELRRLIRQVKPNQIVVELCPRRLKQVKTFVRTQSEIFDHSDMICGVREAQYMDAIVIAGDVDYMKTWFKWKLGDVKDWFYRLFSPLLRHERKSMLRTKKFIELYKAADLEETRRLNSLIHRLQPNHYKALTVDRDVSLYNNIMNCSGPTILAIVGKAHVPNILDLLNGKKVLTSTHTHKITDDKW